ncbi:MAG: hypothetical protein K1X75_02985 [Leptospirales bacterium]|nr:hypothetical protein [Leptospirales bacterium]
MLLRTIITILLLQLALCSSHNEPGAPVPSGRRSLQRDFQEHRDPSGQLWIERKQVIQEDAYYDVAFPWVREADSDALRQSINAWVDRNALQPLKLHAGASYGKLSIAYGIRLAPGRWLSIAVVSIHCADCSQPEIHLDGALWSLSDQRQIAPTELLRDGAALATLRSRALQAMGEAESAASANAALLLQSSGLCLALAPQQGLAENAPVYCFDSEQIQDLLSAQGKEMLAR